MTGAVPTSGYGSITSLKALGYKPFYDKLNVAAIGCGQELPGIGIGVRNWAPR